MCGRISYLERFRLCTQLQCFILKVMSCHARLNSCLDLMSEYLVMSKKTGHKSGALSRVFSAALQFYIPVSTTAAAFPCGTKHNKLKNQVPIQHNATLPFGCESKRRRVSTSFNPELNGRIVASSAHLKCNYFLFFLPALSYLCANKIGIVHLTPRYSCSINLSRVQTERGSLAFPLRFLHFLPGPTQSRLSSILSFLLIPPLPLHFPSSNPPPSPPLPPPCSIVRVPSHSLALILHLAASSPLFLSLPR